MVKTFRVQDDIPESFAVAGIYAPPICKMLTFTLSPRDVYVNEMVA